MIKYIKSIIFKTHVYKVTDMRDMENDLFSFNVFELYEMKIIILFSKYGKYYRIKKLIKCS